MSDQHRLQIIVGSTRPDRAADRVLPWVVQRAEEHLGFEVEVLDLRDWVLPMFQENMQTVGDFHDPTYSQPIVREWNRKLTEASAYVFVTAEYNHSIPGVLKNAIDSVFVSFALRNKPAAFVGYSSGITGGSRAVEHLAHVAVETEMVPLRNSVLISQVEAAFDGADKPVNPLTELAMSIMLDDLAWWSSVLSPARAAGQLPPGALRFFQAAFSADTH